MKANIVSVFIVTAILLVISFFAWLNFSSKTNTTAREIQFETVVSDLLSSFARDNSPKEQVVVNDQKTWGSVVKKHGLKDIQIDFTKETSFAAFYGLVQTGGYSVKISRVEEKNGIVYAYVLETRPGKGCFVTQAFSAPYHIVKLEKINKKVEFIVEQKTVDCQ